MTENIRTKTECQKSFIAGLVGGTYGYLVGAGYESQWLSFVLFFVVGYLGYNWRKMIEVIANVVPRMAKEFWEGLIKFNPRPILTSWLLPIIIMMFWSVLNSGITEIQSFSEFLTKMDLLALANFEWIQTGHHSMGGAYARNDPFIARLIIGGVLCGFMVIFFGICFWCLIGWFTHGLLKLLVNIYHMGPVYFFACILIVMASIGIKIAYYAINLPCKLIVGSIIRMRNLIVSFFSWLYSIGVIGIYKMVFYLTIAPIILAFKGMCLIIIGIHSARRFACGISTLGGGIIYMIFVPFSITHIPLALTALCCGLACGTASVLTSLALDGEIVSNTLNSFVQKPIKSFVPVLNK